MTLFALEDNQSSASARTLSSDASVLVSCVVAVESDGARVGGGALCVLAGGPGRWWIHLLSSPCLPVLKSCKKPQTQHLAAERDERTPERLRRSQSSRRSNVGIPTASDSRRLQLFPPRHILGYTADEKQEQLAKRKRLEGFLAERPTPEQVMTSF